MTKLLMAKLFSAYHLVTPCSNIRCISVYWKNNNKYILFTYLIILILQLLKIQGVSDKCDQFRLYITGAFFTQFARHWYQMKDEGRRNNNKVSFIAVKQQIKLYTAFILSAQNGLPSRFHEKTSCEQHGSYPRK